MKSQVIWLLAGVLIGLLVLAGWRFATYKNDVVHYHANFGIFINGQRDPLNDPLFYSDVAGCSEEEPNLPHHRADMHDQVNDVVHVHAHAVTWGHFLENLGYSISDKHLKTPTGVFVSDENNKVSFLLNDNRLTDVSNRVIQNEDKLLISYGSNSTQTAIQNPLNAQFDAISNSAAEYNQKQDPASCAGDVKPGWRERLKNIFQ